MLFFEIDRLRAVTETLLCVKSHHTAQLFSFSTTAFPIMFYSVLKSFLCIYCMYQLKKKTTKKNAFAAKRYICRLDRITRLRMQKPCIISARNHIKKKTQNYYSLLVCSDSCLILSDLSINNRISNLTVMKPDFFFYFKMCQCSKRYLLYDHHANHNTSQSCQDSKRSVLHASSSIVHVLYDLMRKSATVFRFQFFFFLKTGFNQSKLCRKLENCIVASLKSSLAMI